MRIYSAYAKEASARLCYQTAPKPLGEGGPESSLFFSLQETKLTFFGFSRNPSIGKSEMLGAGTVVG